MEAAEVGQCMTIAQVGRRCSREGKKRKWRQRGYKFGSGGAERKSLYSLSKINSRLI